MFAIPAFDVAGPGVIIVAAGMSLLVLMIFMAVITVLEAVVLVVMKWGTFWRSLLASFVMNAVTTLVGFVILAGPVGLLVDFILSVLIEGVILLLFNRGASRKNWIAALVANGVSYLFVILPIYLIFTYFV